MLICASVPVQRSVRPQVVTTFELPGCTDMWTVLSNEQVSCCCYYCNTTAKGPPSMQPPLNRPFYSRNSLEGWLMLGNIFFRLKTARRNQKLAGSIRSSYSAGKTQAWSVARNIARVSRTKKPMWTSCWQLSMLISEWIRSRSVSVFWRCWRRNKRSWNWISRASVFTTRRCSPETWVAAATFFRSVQQSGQTPGAGCLQPGLPNPGPRIKSNFYC